MKSDEGFSDMLDKSILTEYQYENVIPNHFKEFKKGCSLAAFFFE